MPKAKGIHDLPLFEAVDVVDAVDAIDANAISRLQCGPPPCELYTCTWKNIDNVPIDSKSQTAPMFSSHRVRADDMTVVTAIATNDSIENMYRIIQKRTIVVGATTRSLGQ